MARPLIERFIEKVAYDQLSECWLWIASVRTCNKGNVTLKYGQIWAGERTAAGHPKPSLAHRVSYELFVGPIPVDLDIDHLCRNTLCVNPRHLEPVTVRVNNDRSPICISTVNKKKTHCPSGHEYSVQNTHVDSTGGRHCRICDKERHAQKYVSVDS